MASEKNNPPVVADAEAARVTSAEMQNHDNDASSSASAKDEAIAMVGEQGHSIDPAVAARAVRKIDLFLIPAMIFGCKPPSCVTRPNDSTPPFHTPQTTQPPFPAFHPLTPLPDGIVYYDKAILGSAVLFGMTTDLQLTTTDRTTTPPTVSTARLSWATSLFYFGMLAGLYPMSFALQRFPIGRVLGAVVVLWGGICMLTAAVTTYKGLYAQRFFLGFVESIVPTGFMTIVAGYYTQKEQALRQSWWFSSTGLFTVVGGGLNYGFAQIQGGGLRSWQYIYLLAGVVTVVFGLVCFAMPNSPVTAWFLTEEERFAAVERLRAGQTGVRCSRIKMAQVRESLADVKTYLVFVMMASA